MKISPKSTQKWQKSTIICCWETAWLGFDSIFYSKQNRFSSLNILRICQEPKILWNSQKSEQITRIWKVLLDKYFDRILWNGAQVSCLLLSSRDVREFASGNKLTSEAKIFKEVRKTKGVTKKSKVWTQVPFRHFFLRGLTPNFQSLPDFCLKELSDPFDLWPIISFFVGLSFLKSLSKILIISKWLSKFFLYRNITSCLDSQPKLRV